MAGIRVHIPELLLDKYELNDLRIMLKDHFEERRHGGSDIKEMHFPVLQYEAVIIYEESSVVDGVMRIEHTIDGKKLCIRRLPQCQIYRQLHTDLDPDMASIIQGCGIIDTLEHVIKLEMQYDKKKKTLIGFAGSWYQLETAWNFIDSLMAQQKCMLLQNKLDELSYNRNIDGKGRHSRSAGHPSSDEDEDLSLQIHQLDHEPRRIQQREEHKNSEEDLIPLAGKAVGSEHIAEKSSASTSARQRQHEKTSLLEHAIEVDMAVWKETPHDELSSQQNQNRKKTKMVDEHDAPQSLLCSHLDLRSDHPKLSSAGKEHISKSSVYQGGTYAVSAQMQHKNDILSNQPRHEELDGEQVRGLVVGKDVDDERCRIQTKHCLMDNMDDSDGTPSLGLHGQGFAFADQSLPSGVESNARQRDSTQNETFNYFASIKNEPVTKQRVQNGGVIISKPVQDMDDSTGQDEDSVISMPHQDECLNMTFSADEKNPELEFMIGDIHVVVMRGDITKENSEGIVSAARNFLDNHVGIAKVIATAAGNQLQRECKDFIKKYKYLVTTKVTLTSAGGCLNDKVTCVLHAVGPVWNEKSSSDETFQHELTATYVNCFQSAEERWLPSLSLPLISSGNSAGNSEVPIHLCVRSFIDGLLIFIDKLETKQHLKEIHLINSDLERTQLTIVILQQLLEMGIKKLTREALENCEKKYRKEITTTKPRRSNSLPRFHQRESVPTTKDVDKEAENVSPSWGRSSSFSRRTNTTKVKERHLGQIASSTSTQTSRPASRTDVTLERSERDQDGSGSSHPTRTDRDGQPASTGRPFSAGPSLTTEKSAGSSSTRTRPASKTGVTSERSERDQDGSGSSLPTRTDRDGQPASAGRPFSAGPSLTTEKSAGSSSTRTRPASKTGVTSERSERDQDGNGSFFPSRTGRDGQSNSGVRPFSAGPSLKSQKSTGSSKSHPGPRDGGSVGQTKSPPLIKQSLFSQEPTAPSKNKERGYLKTDIAVKAKSQPLKAVHDSQDSDSNMESPRCTSGDNSDDSLGSPRDATSEKMIARRDLKPPEHLFSSLPLDLEKSSHKSNSRMTATLPLGLSQRHVVERDMDTVCPICLELMHKPKSLPKCNHKFCSACIAKYFKTCKPVCPQCGYVYGVIKGDQPKGGKMTYKVDKDLIVPGYEDAEGAIIITYDIPGGKQENHHPRPGQMYNGLYRSAYLPNCSEGRLVLKLLQRAFDAGLIFTVGESKTTGRDNMITWNDIHHKTSIHGGSTNFGYPDPTYLQRVQEELAAKGITKDMV